MAAITPVGSEFQVNTYTDRRQSSPDIATLADGGYVITWESYLQDGESTGIYAQRYNADDTPAGGEFQVHTNTAGQQSWVTVTALSNGGFVITWTSYTGKTDGYEIVGQQYDSTGAVAGGEFVINSTSTDHQYDAMVSALDDGGFVVVWHSNGQDGSGLGIFGQRYDAAGLKAGTEFQINSETDNAQRKPAVSSIDGGGFIVVWESNLQDGEGYGIFGQQYDANGVAIGGEFQVNTYSTLDQNMVSVAGLADGGFVVTWDSRHQDGDYSGIFGQRFDAGGNALGDEFQINTFTNNHQTGSNVAALPDGGFIVSWSSNLQDGDAFGIYAQRYDADGNRVGVETLINTNTTNFQVSPAIAVQADGTFIITWDSNFGGSSISEIIARRFDGLSVDSGIYGTIGDDTLYDTDVANWMDGLGGNDTLYGLDGNDLIFGNTGNDLLFGGDGHDQLDGGTGNDVIHGGQGQDTLYGQAGNDTLRGGRDNDTLYGGAGNDRLKGNNGDDTLYGGIGNDRLKGQAGNDTLIGGAGKDVLIGGTGADTFVFNAISDSGLRQSDRIKDFEVGIDQIDLSDLIPGAFTFIDNDRFSGTGAEIRAVEKNGDTFLRIDVDGDGRADMKIFVSGIINFTADDFIL